MLDWEKLLNDERFSKVLKRQRPKVKLRKPKMLSFAKDDFRMQKESDYDRILFSTPLRRMGDKTQVFPLENIESIHTRLTHSHEVSNLARSLGIRIALKRNKKGKTLKGLPRYAIRTIPATLAAAGLAHDIGNPPFGHQGENAIRDWFKHNEKMFIKRAYREGEQLTKQQKNDFFMFDGNAQTLRVLSKLQVIRDDLGLNLTLGTLASMMKYVASSNEVDSSLDIQSIKKVGFFTSEQSLVDTVRDKTGLDNYVRHPLAIIMEACDDIVYSVLDVEDAIKKDLVSFHDLIFSLRNYRNGKRGQLKNPNHVIWNLCNRAEWEYETICEQVLPLKNKLFPDKKTTLKEKLPSKEIQDLATQMFRIYAIRLMVCAVDEAFREEYKNIMKGKFTSELIKKSKVFELCEALKKFERENVHNHKTVREVELKGHYIINQLMYFLWEGITDREDYRNVASDRRTPFSKYVYDRISINYRRMFEGKTKIYHKDEKLPIIYKEMQLLTDMISGMTDNFCIELHDDLAKYHKSMGKIG